MTDVSVKCGVSRAVKYAMKTGGVLVALSDVGYETCLLMV